MTTDPATVLDGSDLQTSVEIVAETRASDLMVVDTHGHFHGVLSEGDILRAALPALDDILEAGGTVEDAYDVFLRRGSRLASLPIAPLVIDDPLVAQPDDHIAKVTVLLVDRQIRLLPVVDGERLVGTVSRADICRALVDEPTPGT